MKRYRCKVCGLHYASRDVAEECYRWCSAHNSCSLEITRHSLERAKGGK